VSAERPRPAVAAALVAAVAFLPFLRGVLGGSAFYFRDLSLHFFPLRRFALEGLARGELRLWNPLVHEGIPLSLPALGYPVDLVQLLRSDEAFLSLVLALHVPLAAIGAFALARGLGSCVVAASGSALVYALGGFFLASLNLYIYAQAAAWAPFVALGLVRLLGGPGGRALAGTALVVGVSLSTTGVELVGQAILAGLLLGVRPGRELPRRLAAALAAIALGAALAAPVLLLVTGQLAGSARAHGFPTDVVLAHSVHPFTLVQTLVGGLYGNLHDLANRWWGDNFFPRGFAYVVSLYLGAAALSLAAIGLASRRGPWLRLALLAGLGLGACLGRYAGLAPIVDALPAAHAFRFPVKAFFSVHLAVALLAGLGLGALASGRRWRTLAAFAAGLGSVLVAAQWLPLMAPRAAAAFAAAFLPSRFGPEARQLVLAEVLGDAALGGSVALALGGLAVLATRGAIGARRGAWLAAGVVAADLLRTGAGLNPMVSADFYRPSAELAASLAALRDGRVFTCSVEASPAYLAARHARGADHEAWSFAALLETLTPSFNVGLQVPTALSLDLTMLVSTERALTPEEGSCRDLAGILPRLREAGVSRVVSLDPLAHAELAPDFTTSPPRIAPLTVHVYRLLGPLPRLALTGPGEIAAVRERPGRLTCTVTAAAATTLVVREARAPGWSVSVDGEPRALRDRNRNLAVELEAGRSEVRFEYRPRGLGPAIGASLAALAAVAVLARRRRVPKPRVPEPDGAGDG
jgi:hypothetical protein